MIFNSISFLIFLGFVLVLYYRLGHRGQNWLLLVASYVFYGWWDYRFVALLLFTTFFDYFCALWIEAEPRPSRRRLLLTSSMMVNLGVLGIFKYFNFFAQSLQDSLALFGISLSFVTLHVVLPVGISFYTFLSMSYTIDVYRRELKATHNPVDFMLYVAFFPHLVAGPIVRASILLPQCQRTRKIVASEVANGLWLILMGYVKKVVIADRLSQAVTWGFAKGSPPFADANSWLVIYAFAFQIYGDFSGYSDIAWGVAKLMGFELVVNFRAPYLVTNPADFWRHWHISLSTWLRDYLYIPLGGNRHGRLNTYRNLMITMGLGGLWHGAGVAYVLWGLYQGTLLVCHRAWQDFRLAQVAVAGFRKLRGAGEQLVSLVVRRLSAMAAQRTARTPASALECSEAAPSDALFKAELALVSQGSVTRPATQEEAIVSLSSSAVISNPKSRDVVQAKGRPEVSARATRRWTPLALLTRLLLVSLFFHITCLGWLLFRAGSLPAGVDPLGFIADYFRTMFIVPRSIHSMVQGVVLLGALSLFFQWKCETMNRFSQWPVKWQMLGVLAGILAITGLGVFEGAQFIYFQF